MQQISKIATIHAPLAQVWETIADVGSIAQWHPGVERSPVLSNHPRGLGATRRVELYDGSSAVEEVTSWEDGSSLTVTMSEFTMPFTFGAATFSVKADGKDRTEVTMTMNYSMKYGLFGWLMNALMLKRIIAKLLQTVLEGLNHHLVTGEFIGQKWTPASA